MYRGQVKDVPNGRSVREGFGVVVYKNKVSVKANKKERPWYSFTPAVPGGSAAGGECTVKTEGAQYRIYEGTWVEDKRDGHGYEVFSDGNTYQGGYKQGKPHGKGIYTWANSEIYEGEFKMGVKDGYGVWKGTQGDSYIG